MTFDDLTLDEKMKLIREKKDPKSVMKTSKILLKTKAVPKYYYSPVKADPNYVNNNELTMFKKLGGYEGMQNLVHDIEQLKGCRGKQKLANKYNVSLQYIYKVSDDKKGCLDRYKHIESLIK